MSKEKVLISLVGEQPAANIIPVYELSPDRIVLAKSGRTGEVAERLKDLFLASNNNRPVSLVDIDAYDANDAYEVLKSEVGNPENAIIYGNITSGTKPMAFALQRVLRELPGREHRLVYYRTEKSQGLLYYYDPETLAFVESPAAVSHTISLDEYLAAYWGMNAYKIKNRAQNSIGHIFEGVVYAALKDCVDEIKRNVVRVGKALEADILLRCGNQVGVVEVKAGDSEPKKGLDQLNTAGDKLAFGTYVKKFLVVSKIWTRDEKAELLELAEAHGIKVIGLPSFDASNKTISEEDRKKLVSTIREDLRCQGDVEC